MTDDVFRQMQRAGDDIYGSQQLVKTSDVVDDGLATHRRECRSIARPKMPSAENVATVDDVTVGLVPADFRPLRDSQPVESTPESALRRLLLSAVPVALALPSSFVFPLLACYCQSPSLRGSRD